MDALYLYCAIAAWYVGCGIGVYKLNKRMGIDCYLSGLIWPISLISAAIHL